MTDDGDPGKKLTPKEIHAQEERMVNGLSQDDKAKIEKAFEALPQEVQAQVLNPQDPTAAFAKKFQAVVQDMQKATAQRVTSGQQAGTGDAGKAPKQDGQA